MPYYDYSCTTCEQHFEKKMPFESLEQPTTEPCPNCAEVSVVYVPTFSGIADPIRIGARRPPSEFVNGVLGRMEYNVPDGTVKGRDGKTRVKHVKFDGRYTPTR